MARLVAVLPCAGNQPSVALKVPRYARDDGVDGPHPASVCHTGSGQTATSERGPSMEKASMIGLDIAKNVFEVHGRSAAGEVVLRRSLRRGQVEKLFAKLAP